jgi:protein MpaA
VSTNSSKIAALYLVGMLTAFFPGVTGCGRSTGGATDPHGRWAHGSSAIGEHRTALRYPVYLGRSVGGKPIYGTVIDDGPEVVLIMATIHGNEAAGTPLVQRLELHLIRHADLTQGRRIILVPVVNPDGRALNLRHNLNGVDLNRNFPADNFNAHTRHGSEPLSQPESRAIHKLIEYYEPARIVSIHQPLSCIDYDGPAQKLAEAMAGGCDLPVRRLGSRPGSLGSYAGQTGGIPIVTLELPRAADRMTDDEKWNNYGAALVEAICFTPVEAK